jgi:hypothetical protein
LEKLAFLAFVLEPPDVSIFATLFSASGHAIIACREKERGSAADLEALPLPYC